ncbi:MAG: DUF1972 domain-containing protein [Candidatus Aminicenantes bacterium]|nr:DUF1972 domain-containing protein [Candidatus Aminicenantes bacterium]
MKIALIGSRGIPAKYGGFETFVEELGKRLVRKGYTIDVYCRSGYYQDKIKTYHGINLIYLPEPKIKTLETLLHTLISIWHALWNSNDILFVLNSANSPWILFPKLFKKKTLLHMDGIEWKRGKWSSLGKAYFRFAEKFATKISPELICDSREIQKFFKKEYGKDIHTISYGADLRFSRDKSILDRFSLEPNEYVLQITRFEPENNPLLSIQAFKKLDTTKKLVFVGGARYESEYTKKMYATLDQRVQFLGFIYDKSVLVELLCNCSAYIHGNEVGGTNPALLEAMASGCFVISRDVPYNREVLQDAGIYFEKNSSDLEHKLQWTLNNKEQLQQKKEEARTIIQQQYNWDLVVEQYEKLFQSLS